MCSVVQYYASPPFGLVCSWKACVSEMDVTTACKGAASIVGRGERVVVISEYDPMVRVRHDPTTEKTLKDNVVSLLTRQKTMKIKLLE